MVDLQSEVLLLLLSLLSSTALLCYVSLGIHGAVRAMLLFKSSLVLGQVSLRDHVDRRTCSGLWECWLFVLMNVRLQRGVREWADCKVWLT